MGTTANITNGAITNNGTTANSISEAAKLAEKKSGGTLDKDAFLQLLVAQMKYQDPMEPTDNTEYIAQLATFSELENMQNMSASMDMQRASGLVGQYVYIEDPRSNGETKLVEGIVDYVTYSGNKTYLSVGGDLYDLENLKTVADADYTAATQVAAQVAEYIKKLPAVDRLKSDDYNSVGKLMSVYSSMTSYEKSFLSEDDLQKINKYATWYTEKTKEMKEAADNNSEG